MADKNKKEDSIPQEIIDSISGIEPELLIKCESSPVYPAYNFDISEMLDDSKKKKEKEKEYKIGNYLIKKTLGQGTFGKVKLGIYLPSQEKVAIKILEKERIIERDDEVRVKREFDMLAQFNHPNVILVAEIFESADSFFSVMEYCEGGELFNFIVKNRRLTEEEAAFFYYQLINGLEYIHSLGIVHRDLKPENLLLTKDHLLKIIDFGLSNYFKKGQKELLVTPCGSPCYASPEMVAGKKYNGFKIDIWSTGIILYAMLCGYLPFEDKDNDLLFAKILECKLEFPKYITKLSKDLIEKILVTDPDKRITIPEIKKHPFFIKGKELFEQEFSICQMDKDEDTELNYESIDLNNILDIPIPILHDNDDKENINDINEIDKKQKKKPRKIETKEIDFKNINKKRKKENKISIKDLEQGNITQRLNTDYDENSANLRNEFLIGLDKNEHNEIKHRNNSSMKKNINRNKNVKNKSNINNANTNKKNGPFRRDLVYLKNKNNNKDNEKNHYLKKDIKVNRQSRDFRNNKKLIKTNKYNNITKQNQRKKNIGNSVNLRNLNYKNKNKNLIKRRINYTNIIKNKFNSKENIRKKENIYINNINNTIDEENMSNKKNIDYDFKLYNQSVNNSKKPRSLAKKKMKLTPLDTTYQTNKRYLKNLFYLNSSIKKYEKKLNNTGVNNPTSSNTKNSEEGIKYNIIPKNYNSSVERENIMIKNLSKEKNSKTKINKDKLKINNNNNNNINNLNYNTINNSHMKSNKNNNNNINIIDNTTDEDITIKTEHNAKDSTKNNKFKISPKNKNNLKANKDKFIKKNVHKLNHFRLLKNNSNNQKYNYNNGEDIKVNYYLNEIEQKKTIDEDNYKTHKPRLNTDIFDNIEHKKVNQFNLSKMIQNNNNKNNPKSNKTEILVQENISFNNKKGIMKDNHIIKHNSGLNTIDNTLKTEPNKIPSTTKKIKKPNNKFININEKSEQKNPSKKISTANTNNINPKNKNSKNSKRQNDILLNYAKNLNKTSNNFNTIDASDKNPFNSTNPHILEILNNSSNYNGTNNTLNKKINPIRKSSQITNNKKPNVTIKSTVINLNIDTGIILSSVDRKSKPKKINSKRGGNNSISQINNNQIYGLDSKYNNYLANEAIGINHSNTNENFPLKTKSININDNNYNLISLNDDNDSNYNLEVINKNSNFQKIYVYGEKSAYKKNKKPINIKEKDKFNDISKINNKTTTNDKRHIKYKSMKLDDDYGVKGRKRDLKNIYVNANDNSFNINNKLLNLK